jgi:hypothetical protein
MTSQGGHHRAQRPRAPRRSFAVALLVLFGGCNGQQEDRDSTAGSAAGDQVEDLNTFCQTAADLVQLLTAEGSIPGENASPGTVARFEQRLAGLLDRAVQIAPAEILYEVSYAAEITRIDPRSAVAFPDILEILEPIQAIKRFTANECGFETVVVTAREYEFQGIPATLAMGTVAFELRNHGVEVHEMLFARIRGGVSLETLLEHPEEERPTGNHFEELGAGAVATPGGSDTALVTFTEPGRYSVACFVPVGTTSVEETTNGAPHTHEGMFAEFRVKAS